LHYVISDREESVANNRLDQVQQLNGEYIQYHGIRHQFITERNIGIKTTAVFEREFQNGKRSVDEISYPSSCTKRTADNSSMSDDYSTNFKRKRND
jgi:hypothetical protein